MSDIKMSDVWNQPITYGIYENASVAGNVLPRGFGMLFNNEEPARAIVHAVNNHDRMAEEIAELKGVLTNILDKAEFYSMCSGDKKTALFALREIAQLAKLNQEGEE